MKTVTRIIRLMQLYFYGMLALPVLFFAFDSAYVGFTNNYKGPAHSLTPLVIRIIGPYDTLLDTVPHYFLLSILGGAIGVAIGLIRERRKETSGAL